MDQTNPIISQISSLLSEDKLFDHQTLKDTQDGISLLALKNESLLSYITNLLLLSAAQIEQNNDVFSQARDAAIEQRVTLEKGVKGLEAKISYQIDKALRAYRRSLEHEDEEKPTDKATASDEDSDSDSDVDVTSFRPNLAALKSGKSSKPNGRSQRSYDEDDSNDGEYVVPKISSNVPSFEKANRKETRSAPKRRDFAMEEYIRESGDAPIAEPSIGSQIMDFGRGGERTERDRRKDREVQDYEESNFTRISNMSSKRARKEASQRQRDATTKSFFGEDWGFLDGDDRGGSKKRKTGRRH